MLRRDRCTCFHGAALSSLHISDRLECRPWMRLPAHICLMVSLVLVAL